MTETKGDVQHHIGYAYHKLNDRRLMWIEFLEGKIEACKQRIQDSGKPVCAGRRVARETQEETETEALEPATTATEVRNATRSCQPGKGRKRNKPTGKDKVINSPGVW